MNINVKNLKNCQDDCQHWDRYLGYCRKDTEEKCLNDPSVSDKTGLRNLYLKWSMEYKGDD